MNPIRERMTARQVQQSIIGCILLQPECFPVVAEYIESADCFQDDDLAVIYGSMLELRHSGMVPDHISLIAALERIDSGPSVVLAAECLSIPTSTALVEQYAQIMAEDYALRKLAEDATAVAKAAGRNPSIEDITAQAAMMVQDIQRRISKDRLMDVCDFTEDALSALNAMRTANGVDGLATGYRELDMLIGGIKPQDILVVAARPGGGKTAWLVSVALNMARQGVPVLFVSLEMSREQMTRRMIQCVGGVDTNLIKKGFLGDAEYAKALQAGKALALLPVTIIAPNGNFTTNALSGYIRRQMTRGGVGLVIIDYLQLMAGTGTNRQEQVAEISRDIKGAAREFDIPMLVAAQLNRLADGAPPKLSHLRESGAIEQDADRVLFLSPDEKAPKGSVVVKITFDLAKNRHGQTGPRDYEFLPNVQQFRDINAPQEPPQSYEYADDDVPFDDEPTQEKLF